MKITVIILVGFLIGGCEGLLEIERKKANKRADRRESRVEMIENRDYKVAERYKPCVKKNPNAMMYMSSCATGGTYYPTCLKQAHDLFCK
jgi:hypothetical protein